MLLIVLVPNIKKKLNKWLGVILSLMVVSLYGLQWQKDNNNLITFIEFVAHSNYGPLTELNQNEESEFDFGEIHVVYDQLYKASLKIKLVSV